MRKRPEVFGAGSDAPRTRDRLEELRDQVTNLVEASACGALKSSPKVAERLAETELRPAEERECASLEGLATAASVPQPIKFYRDFIEVVGKHFKQNARDTRETLREIVGEQIKLTPTKDHQELVVSCSLGSTTFSLPQLSRALVVVQFASRTDTPEA
jgi:hypothetical protein